MTNQVNLEFAGEPKAETAGIPWRKCKHCDGLGEVDPTEVVDENDLEAVRKELIDSVTDGGKYGIVGELRGHRIRMASRVLWLANRIVWLENLENLRAEEDAKYAAMRAKHAN